MEIAPAKDAVVNGRWLADRRLIIFRCGPKLLCAGFVAEWDGQYLDRLAYLGYDTVTRLGTLNQFPRFFWCVRPLPCYVRAEPVGERYIVARHHIACTDHTEFLVVNSAR